MPKTTRSGAASQSELPSTLQRSDDLAQRTFAHAYDAATELGIVGRSRMRKEDLVEAIEKENDCRSRRAREGGT